MNKLNQVLLTVLLLILIITIPYLVYLTTLSHDAKMCDYIRAGHLAYKSADAFQSYATPFLKYMIFKVPSD